MSRSAGQRIRVRAKAILDVSLDRLGRRPPVAKRFVVLARGRSGSTALVSILDAVPGIRCEGEILHDRVPWPERFVDARSRARPCDAYGFKVLAYQIRDVQRLRDREGFVRRLHARGFEVVYLRRENLLRHAISSLRARTLGFHRRRGEPAAPASLEIDVDALVARMEQIEGTRDYEERLLEGVPHMSLSYERDLRDEARHQSTLDRVCDLLGVKSAPARSGFERISPPSLRESISNYDEVERRLASTRWARFIEGP